MVRKKREERMRGLGGSGRGYVGDGRGWKERGIINYR